MEEVVRRLDGAAAHCEDVLAQQPVHPAIEAKPVADDEHGAAQRRIWTAETDRTSAIAEGIARDKDLTKRLIAAVGVPVPDGRIVESPAEAWAAANPDELTELDLGEIRVSRHHRAEPERAAAFDDHPAQRLVGHGDRYAFARLQEKYPTAGLADQRLRQDRQQSKQRHAVLDVERGIAIRAGHHCAQPLMDALGIDATARASFGVYNGPQDIEALAQGLERVTRIFG